MLTNRVSFLSKMLNPVSTRAFSAASIADRFEAAYEERVAQLARSPKKM